MRRTLLVALSAAIALSLLPTAASAGTWRLRHCRYATSNGQPGYTDREIRKTIRCAFRKVVGGSVDQALCVAARESGFNEFADNPRSSASGVFQFVDGTWDGVRSTYRRFWRRHDLHRSVYNARSNVMGAARYVAAVGWAPWGGGC